MSFSSLLAYLLNLLSDLKGTTIAESNGRDMSRWAMNCFRWRFWFFTIIKVRHCAQLTRLHLFENLEQKIIIRKFYEIQLSSPSIGIEHRKQWSKAADESSHVLLHASNEVEMFDIIFSNISPRSQKIEKGLSRYRWMSESSSVENRNQVGKSFHVIPNMDILWRYLVLM